MVQSLPVVNIAAIKLDDAPQFPKQRLSAGLHTQLLNDLNQVITNSASGINTRDWQHLLTDNIGKMR